MKIRVTVEVSDDIRRALANSHGTDATKDGKATRQGCASLFKWWIIATLENLVYEDGAYPSSGDRELGGDH
jgi:hypothetical protein